MSRSVSRQVAACVVILLSAVATTLAQNPDAVLDAAGVDYRNGNYRATTARLGSLSAGTVQLSLPQQLAYWNLRADVAAASNLPVEAEQAAGKYLALLNQESALPAYERRNLERRALVRLARIKRTLAGEEIADGVARPSSAPLLQDARRLYERALAVFEPSDEVEPLWEATTRFELAGALELLKQPDRAKAEYLAADRSAAAAVAKLAPGEETIEEFLRGAAIVRWAHLSDSAADRRRQAGQALKLYQARLRAGATTLAARATLLRASAACYQQAEENGFEKQVLSRILDDIKKARPQEAVEVDPSLQPEVMIRLAELADEEANAAGQARQASQALYREAAKRYAEELTRIKQRIDEARQPGGAKPQAVAKPQAAGQPQANDKELTEDERIGRQLEYLVQLQIVYVRLEDFSAAIKTANELLQLRREVLSANDPELYRTISSLGSLHAKRARAAKMRAVGDEPDLRAAREDVASAKKHLQAALDFWRKHTPKSPKDLVSTLNYYAEVLRYDGDFRGAERMLSEVASILASQPVYGADDLRAAEFHTNQAAVQAALGQFNSAKENYDRAAQIAGDGNAAGRELQERRRLQSMIHLNEAQLYKSQRQFGEARGKCDKAVQAARNAGIEGAELAPFELAQASLLVAEAEQDALAPGTIAGETGAAEVNRDDVRRKLEEAIRIASGVAGSPLELTMADHLDASARYRLYEYCGGDVAQLQEAEQIWRQIVERPGDESPQMVNLTARVSNQLVAIALQDAARARQLSFALSQEESPDEKEIAEWTNRSEARLQQAATWSVAGERAAKQMIAYPAVRVQSLLSRALVLSAHADIQGKKAAAGSVEAGGQSPFAPQTPQKGTVPSGAAAASATATRDQAIAALREAAQLIEMPRAMTVGAEAERALYFAQFAPVFDLLVDLLVENGQYKEAIEASDLRRSRTYQDQLRACGVDLAETADEKAAMAVRRAAEEYYAMANRLKENWSDQEQRSVLSQELAALRSKLVEAERDMKSTSVAARQLLRESGDAAAIASELRAGEWSDDEVALIYYIGTGKSYIFACGGKLGVIGQELKVTPEQAGLRGLRASSLETATNEFHLGARDVAQLVRDVRVGVEKLPDDASRDRASRGSSALTLAYSPKVVAATDYVVTDILLPPNIRQKVLEAGPRHLIVIPDGALHQLPLELLPIKPANAAVVEQTTYVLDVFPPISYAPSLLIERKLRKGERVGGHPIALLSLADPSYSEPPAAAGNANDAANVSGAGREFRQLWGGGFARLDGFKKESLAVCAAFENSTPSGGRIVTLLENDATERKFKDIVRAQPGQIGFLHVAAHGVVSQEYNNLFGALALTPPRQTTADDDGYLSLHEVFGLMLKDCEMVVLSACDTNRGAESPLEAGSTMARAFICAGATRVVCSHWGADDNATTALVSDFMTQVSRETSANRTVDFAKALRDAKKKVRESTPSPYFWAPFVLIGPPSNEGFGDGERAVAVQ